MARSREEHLKAKREGMARRRAADPALARKKLKDWCDRNREHVRQKVRNYYNKRFFWSRAQRLRRDGFEISPYELALLWKTQRGRCALSGRRLTRETAELDHIIPRKRGGDSRFSNIRWVRKEANRAKRDLTDVEFIRLCADVLKHVGNNRGIVTRLP